MAKAPEFDPIADIEMLQRAAAAYHSPPAFKVGDLVEFFDPGNARTSLDNQPPMPMIVLELIGDLEPITGLPKDRGLLGIRVMMPETNAAYPDAEVEIYAAWEIAPYSGKRPHQQ